MSTCKPDSDLVCPHCDSEHDMTVSEAFEEGSSWGVPGDNPDSCTFDCEFCDESIEITDHETYFEVK